MTGRPTVCTRRLIQTITDLMVDPGLSLTAAADLAGVSAGQPGRWLTKAEEPDTKPIYREFRDAVTRARRDRERARLERIAAATQPQTIVERRTKQVYDRKTGKTIELVETVTRRVPGDWRAEAWLLEHSPDTKADYSTRTELTGADGAPVAAVVPIVVDAEAAAEMAAIMARVKYGPGDGSTDG